MSLIHEILKEMSPYVDSLEKMEDSVLPSISISQFKRAWNVFANYNDKFIVCKSKYETGFIGGFIEENKFNIVVDVNCDTVYRNAPTFLSKAFQVSMVNTSPSYQERGYAKRMYKNIIKKYILISDTEQYQSSKQLWKSLSRESDVYVYIWNDYESSFIEENKLPKRYTSDNIDDINIFGQQDIYYKIVLVAMNTPIKERN